MKDSDVQDVPRFLHKDLIVRSDKQQSAQGQVFYVKKRENLNQISDEYVLKIYPDTDKRSYDIELEILNRLKQQDSLLGFPQLISNQSSETQSEILLQALGPNLRNLQKQCPMKRFSNYTILQITLQLIERIRAFHKMGYVHNDLKLENILIGHKDPTNVYLIDFGLSQKYLDSNGVHVEKYFCKKFSGNFLFASLNSCRGNNKSRRDDMESVIYIMIYLLNNNYVPWCDIEQKCKKEYMEFKDILKERLEIDYTKRLFKLIPRDLINMLKYVLTLRFDQEPDYEYVINSIQQVLTKEMAKAASPNQLKFEWAKTIATKAQENMQQEVKCFEVGEQSLGKMSLHFQSKYIGSNKDSKQIQQLNNSKNASVQEKNSSRAFEQILQGIYDSKNSNQSDGMQQPQQAANKQLSKFAAMKNSKRQSSKLLNQEDQEEQKQEDSYFNQEDGSVVMQKLSNSQGLMNKQKKSSQFARMKKKQIQDDNKSDYEEENLEYDEIDENYKLSKEKSSEEEQIKSKDGRTFSHNKNNLQTLKDTNQDLQISN